jgi:hypothetical protein
MISFVLGDNTTYLATGSIDKSFGIFKVLMPSEGGKSKVMKNMMARGQWSN